MFQAFLIKYGEIGVKGKNRYVFEDALVKRIKEVLRPVEGHFQVTKDQAASMWRQKERLTMKKL